MKQINCQSRLVNIIMSVIFIVLIVSCNSNGLVGKKLYVLDGKIEYSTYYGSLKEMELNFISNDKVETRMTMYADAMGYRFIGDTTSEVSSKIYSYKYQDGILELPSLNLIAKINFIEDGKVKTNEGEYLYPTSIVTFLGTDSAYGRLKDDPKGNLARFFKNYIKKKSKTLIRIENGNIIFNGSDDKSNEAMEYESVQKEFVKLSAQVDLINSNYLQMQGEFKKMQNDMASLNNEIKAKLSEKRDIKQVQQLLNQLSQKVNEFNTGVEKLKDENRRLSEIHQ